MKALPCFALVVALLGCRAQTDGDPLVERARFGIFFGGQIQDRSELPFELDQTKERIGIRIDFRRPLSQPALVGWEIARPAAIKNGKSAAAPEQVVEVGDVRARLGESRLDVPLLLRSGQGLGTWHVRVKVDGRAVIDRDVRVFDPRERRDVEADAGH